jgi:multiple sugar transport system permease protein
MTQNKESAVDRVLTTVRGGLLLLLTVIMGFPILYIISISFRGREGIYTEGVRLLPENPTLEPWGTAFGYISESLINTLLIASGTAVLALLITIPAAYVFGRLQFPGKKLGFYTVLIALLFPYILLIVPITSIWYNIGLYNTIPGLWIAYQVFVTPFAIWILRDFFEKLPTNLEEAAQIYGCSQFGAFYRVILPLATPAIVAVGFLAFLIGWNDFLFSSMLTDGTGPRPAVVVLYLTTTGGQQVLPWRMMMAQALIIGVPPVTLYMVSRKYLSETFSM